MSRWIKGADSKRLRWTDKRRDMILSLWKEMNDITDVSPEQVLIVNKHNDGIITKKVIGQKLGSDVLEQFSSQFALGKVETQIDLDSLFLSNLNMKNKGIPTETEILSRGNVLRIYIEMLDKLDIEINIGTTLFGALINNCMRNVNFFQKKDNFNIVMEDGSIKTLNEVINNDFNALKRLKTINVDLIKSYLNLRIYELLTSDLTNKKGINILEMPAFSSNQLSKGIDCEEMLAELAEVITITSIDSIKCQFQELNGHPEVQTFFHLYEGMKKKLFSPDRAYSLSPGFGATSRTSASGRGIVDHVLKFSSKSSGLEESVYLYIQDKRWRWKLDNHTQRYYYHAPEAIEAKEAIIHEIHFSNGEGDKLWKEYKHGLATVDKTEKKVFQNLLEEMQKPNSIKRLLIFRMLSLTKDKLSGRFVFKMSLQIGENTGSTVKDAIKLLGNLKLEEFRTAEDEITRTVNYLAKKGIDPEILLNKTFWIKDPKGKILGIDQIISNFKEGFKKSMNVSIPKEGGE